MHICDQELHCELCNETCSSYIEVVPVQKYKEAISDLIYNTLDNIYCDNCRYEDMDNFYYHCEDCHRKAMNWSVARQVCDELAEEIVNLDN